MISISVMSIPGLRGAIAYALALNLSDETHFANSEVIRVLDTTTLIIVLFTIVVFGGSTLPLLKVRVSTLVSEVLVTV